MSDKEVMKIPYISVSRKQLWDECKQKYVYKYHLNIKSPEPEPIYFAYGKTIHTISEVYCKENGKKPLEEIAQQIMAHKIPIDKNENGEDAFAPRLNVAYQKSMFNHLNALKKIFEQFGTHGLTEYPFLYDLDPPNEKCVKGFIDRMFDFKDKFIILDYKTTKSASWHKNATNIHLDLQLRCYARIVQKELNIPVDKIIAGLYYLETGKFVSTSFTEEMLVEAEKLLLNTYNDILNSDPNLMIGNVGGHCYRCDYRSICPFFHKI